MLVHCPDCSKSYDDLDHWTFCPHEYFAPGPGVPQAIPSAPKRRGMHLSPNQVFTLDSTCRVLTAAFGFSTSLVGSVLERADWRDVDLRCILDDDVYDGLIGQNRARLKLMNAVYSDWLAARTGLPIDFQFQRRTEANAEFQGARNFMGVPPEHQR